MGHDRQNLALTRNKKWGAQRDEAREIDSSCLTLAQWLKREIDPLDALLGDLFSTTSRVLFFADTGVGKTMMALSWAFAMAFGRDFIHWKRRRKARVLYIDGEMPRDLMKERLEVLCRLFRIRPDEISHTAHLKILSSEDFEEMPPLNDEQGQKWLDRFIDQTGPYDFVFFDNITSRCSGIMKEEESWDAVKAYTRMLTKRRIGQLWVHHTGHDTSRGYGTKTREWQMDTVIKADKNSGDHIDFNMIFTKKRRAKPSNAGDFKNFRLQLIDGKWNSDSIALTPKGRPNHSEKIVLEALRTAKRQADGSVTEEDWRQAAYRLGISKSDKDQARRKAFLRARMSLAERAAVKAVGDRWLEGSS